ncbi:MAG: Sulfur acceptor protein _ iron-sulfur cluster assembly SufE, partial [uncultured Acidimicrobiales bacterium]
GRRTARRGPARPPAHRRPLRGCSEGAPPPGPARILAEGPAAARGAGRPPGAHGAGAGVRHALLPRYRDRRPGPGAPPLRRPRPGAHHPRLRRHPAHGPRRGHRAGRPGHAQRLLHEDGPGRGDLLPTAEGHVRHPGPAQAAGRRPRGRQGRSRRL